MAKKSAKPTRREDAEEEVEEKSVYLSPDELRAMSLDDLKTAFDQIPIERQHEMRSIYDDQLLEAGAKGEDALEYQVATQLFQHYEFDHVVPVGKGKWSRPSKEVLDAATNNFGLADGDVIDRRGKGSAQKVNPLPLVIMGGVVVFVFFFLIRRNASPSKPVADMLVTPNGTPTLAVSLTPSPVALENIDLVVGKSEGGGVQFPIKLLVQSPHEPQPRIFVVQRRTIRVSEWNYDEDPDTATFISGLTVRPIIGIPFSPENAALFDSMTSGTTFKTQTSTGSTLQYDFVNKLPKVQRSDTGIFSQDGPGIVLILIGERDPTSQARTQFRTVVTASYDPSQELDMASGLISNVAMQPLPPPLLPTLTPTPTPIRRTSLDFVKGGYGADFLMVEVRILNVRDVPVTFKPDDIWVAYGFSPHPMQPRTVCENMPPFTLLPNQAADVTIYFKYSRQEPYATVGFGQNGEWELGFSLPLSPT